MLQNKVRFFALFVLVFCVGNVFSQEPIDVILIGGQSNASGQGYIRNIPKNYELGEDVLFFYSKWLKGEGPAEKWHTLGNASGSADRFGAEIGLGTTLQKNYPKRKFAIIKHALSGSNLYHQWNPGINKTDSSNWGSEFKKFVATVESGLKQLRHDGYNPTIKAMTWQQGEADARDIAGIENSLAYGKRFNHFILRVREQFNCPEMLFVYGYVIPIPQKRFTGRNEVRQAQWNVSQYSGLPLSLEGAVLVETGDLPLRCMEPGVNMLNDLVHFNSEGMLELGKRYAEAMYQSYTSEKVAFKSKAFPGEKSEWKGFARQDFNFIGTQARLVIPDKALPGNPWVWRARFPDWHTEMDSILLNRGFHIAYVNTNNRFGSPKAMSIWNAFYEFMTNHHNLSEKVSLEGVSRGGLFVYNWAKQHPNKVNCIYTEAPVCDFKSWPGGFGTGIGSVEAWENLKKEYGFISDDEAKKWDNLPIDKLDALANAKVPIMHMIGINDDVVPPAENSFKLIDRYVKLGGPATLIPCTSGIQKLHGHHFTIETPEMAADFITYNTLQPEEKLNSSDYHKLRGGIRNSLMKFEREKKGRVAFMGGSITYNGGWRDSICSYLEKRFPETEFDFIAAGIPSMGTTPAAFRLERDVLFKGKIDLLFEEAAVNDASNGRTDKEQVRAMEGIVRHLRNTNPETDIVLMHFVDPDKVETYGEGEIPKVILNHEKVAKLYKLSSINLAKEVTERIDAGEFTWEDDFKNLHPSPFGQGIYAHSMLRYLDQAWSGGVAEDDKISLYQLPDAIDPDNYDNGKLFLAEEARWGNGWELIKKWKPEDGKSTRANYSKVPMLVGKESTGIIEFDFEGRAVGIAVAAGPDAGIIEYAIDGGEWQKQDLFTRWSMHLHLPWYYTLATGLEGKKHTLRIRLTKGKNKQSIGTACRIRYFYVNK